ncbi:MAG: F0F1 ATP synthase subunit A [Bacillota bacterium]|nr:F0F1 ATP synthase subunit A [Bacillota bacterium]
MGSEGFGPRVVFNIGGIPVSETVTVTWFIMALITIFCIVATHKMKKVPKGVQLIGEQFVKTITNMTITNMGEKNVGFAPYIGALFLFLALANIAGLVGLRPPTSDLNLTLCLSIITFLLTQFFGLKSKGLKGYIGGFFQPLPFLLPLNIVGELANPVSLAFRLFGNVVAGVIIMTLVYSGLASLFNLAVPIFQLGFPVALHVYFDLFSGLLQSFIFTMLTMVFISGAME